MVELGENPNSGPASVCIVMDESQKLRARAKAASLLRELEGLRLIPYRDQAGLLTVGIGHRTDDPKPITYEQAMKFFEQDLSIAFGAVADLPVNVNQAAALTSFVFNVGVGAFGRSTMRKFIIAGDHKRAADEFMRWTKYRDRNGQFHESKGLKLRREAEKMLYECEREL